MITQGIWEEVLTTYTSHPTWRESRQAGSFYLFILPPIIFPDYEVVSNSSVWL